MKWDYIKQRIVDGSPGAPAIETRLRRAAIMIESKRWDEDKACAWVLRDFPFVRRIERDARRWPR